LAPKGGTELCIVPFAEKIPQSEFHNGAGAHALVVRERPQVIHEIDRQGVRDGRIFGAGRRGRRAPDGRTLRNSEARRPV
jgi:hypothetical protein